MTNPSKRETAVVFRLSQTILTGVPPKNSSMWTLHDSQSDWFIEAFSMFKKTKVRQILELLHKDLSAREISKTLKVSRNSVAFVKESYSNGKSLVHYTFHSIPPIAAFL